MANFTKHLKTGAIVGIFSGAGLFLLQYLKEKEKNPNQRFNWGYFFQALLAGCAIGAIGGIAADKFEPSSNPNHRGFFHSYTFWILAFVAIYNLCHSRNRNIILTNLAFIGFVGYSSHLTLDMMTPKSLPIAGF